MKKAKKSPQPNSFSFPIPGIIQDDKSGVVRLQLSNSDESVELPGLRLEIDDAGNSTLQDVEFIHLFFISLVKLRENPEVPENLRHDVEEAFALLTTVLKTIRVSLSEDNTKIESYEIALHNINKVRLAPLTPEEQLRTHELYALIAVKKATEAEEEEYNTLTARKFTDEQTYELLSGYVSEFINRPGVFTALRMATMIAKRGQPPEEALIDSKKLFPNSKALSDAQFGLPKQLADNINRVLKDASEGKAIAHYNGAPSPSKKLAYKIKNRESETEFIFDPARAGIKLAEQFATQLMRIKNAKVLQTFFALWKWASLQDSATFTDVPISDVMSLILKAGDKSNFNTSHRREFSEILEYLATISITESIIGERVNRRTGKSRPELRELKNVRIFRLEAFYSVRKQYLSIPRESLSEALDHFDKSVINRFSGSLMPDNPHLFTERASIYFDSLLHLDANKDSKAIIMGFHIQTRFNQLQDKSQCIEVDRAFLINLCDYGKTNQTNPSQATKQLGNNLDKLIKAGLISKYNGLTNCDTDKVKINPPIEAKPKITA